MELKVDIGFDQLLQAIKQLPADKINLLKSELDTKELSNKNPGSNIDFKQFLLTGPVMDDDQYKIFKETRKSLSKWRTK